MKMIKIVILAIALLALFYPPGPAVAGPSAPLSLTASDGTGLEIREIKARTVLDGFLAFTELEITFYNPENRRREGRFQIVLPDGTTASRFAMKIGGHLQEGEIVEKGLARRAYEDFLHRRQDPALLESDSGNRFNARVFPIEARAEKVIILSYSQRLRGHDMRYVLPLKGLPELKKFSLKVIYDSATFGAPTEVSKEGGLKGTVRSRSILSVEENGYVPAEDFVMEGRRGTPENMAMRSGEIAAFRVVPFAAERGKSSDKSRTMETLALLVDTSASQAPYLADTVEALKTLVEGINVKDLHLYTFDQKALYMGKAGGKKEQLRLIERLEAIEPLGASNLEAAFKELKKSGYRGARLIIVSDGVATAGITTASELAGALKNSGFERVDMLIPSYNSDQRLARAVVRAGARPGIHTRLTEGIDAVTYKITRDVFADIPVKVTGAEWFWPEKIGPLQAGEPVIIFAELEGKKRPVLSVNGRKIKYKEMEANPLLLKREWVGERIERLLGMEEREGDRDLKSAMHNEIINLSVTERVLSPYTAMLVLETEADYKRFNIDRRGLADIITIGVDGITTIKRDMETLIRAQDGRRVRRERRDEFKVGANARTETEGMVIDEEPFLDRKAEGFADERPELEESGDVMKSILRSAPAAEAPEPGVVEETDEVRPGEFGLRRQRADEAVDKRDTASPWTGRYAEFRELLGKGEIDKALKFALKWRRSNYSDVMALVALGEAFEAGGDKVNALRAYASLIDYFPARADIRRWAAERLLAAGGVRLATDSLEKALRQRPDHPSGHYLLAVAYWEAGEFESAVDTLVKAKEVRFNPRFIEASRILDETLRLMASDLKRRGKDVKGLSRIEAGLDKSPAAEDELRFVLLWETDANDVDFHIYDRKENHAFYGSRRLKSGGELYADVTQGYGPECFTVKDPKAFPYKLKAHYYNMGPMGYGMGMLHVLRFSVRDGLASEFRPFVVMQNQAYVDMGVVKK